MISGSMINIFSELLFIRKLENRYCVRDLWPVGRVTLLAVRNQQDVPRIHSSPYVLAGCHRLNFSFKMTFVRVSQRKKTEFFPCGGFFFLFLFQENSPALKNSWLRVYHLRQFFGVCYEEITQLDQEDQHLLHCSFVYTEDILNSVKWL